jgi:hypothetical protein
MFIDLKEIEKNVIVEDDHILLDKPLMIKKYEVTILINQINYWYKWEKFVYYLGVFLQYYYIICENSKLPDRLSDIEEFRNNIRLTIGANKKAFKMLMKICNFAKTFKWMQLKWMKKFFTIDDWIEIFCYIYLYNIKGIKKKLLVGLSLLSKARLN